MTTPTARRRASTRIAFWIWHLVQRFLAHDMPVYAGALAFRGLLALVPLALLIVSLLGLFGIQGAAPRLTEVLLRLGSAADEPVPGDATLGGFLSAGAVVGIWSMSAGARLLMGALNAAHGVRETRRPVARFAYSLMFVPALAATTILATLLLLITTGMVERIAAAVGLGGVMTFLGSWLRLPLAFGVIAFALGAVYHFGPSVRPRLRGVVIGAVLAVVCWTATSLAFSVALSTVLNYGATYGSLGAAVALLVYLYLCATVLLLGAEACAMASKESG